MHNYSIILLLFTLCLGCNDLAVQQHQAEQARRSQTVKDLKQLGKKMHAGQTADLASDPVAAEGQ